MSSPINPGRCPVCGELNGCAMADKDSSREQPCWCREETFPQELLHNVAAEFRNKACICRKCVQAYRAD